MRQGLREPLLPGRACLKKVNLVDEELRLFTYFFDQVRSAEVLGQKIDSEFSFTCHIDSVCHSILKR